MDDRQTFRAHVQFIYYGTNEELSGHEIEIHVKAKDMIEAIQFIKKWYKEEHAQYDDNAKWSATILEIKCVRHLTII